MLIASEYFIVYHQNHTFGASSCEDFFVAAANTIRIHVMSLTRDIRRTYAILWEYIRTIIPKSIVFPIAAVQSPTIAFKLEPKL